MKKVACLALVGALGLFGCGGGGSGDDDDDITFQPDASVGTPDAGGGGGECNAVSQTGCQAGEKCAVIIDQLDPYIGHLGCVANGTVAIGDACTEGMAVGTSDNCQAGGECYNGLCHEICSTVNDQCTDGTCQTFVDGSGNPLPTEICLFSCNPLDQSTCPVANEGCYIAADAVCVVDVSGDLGAVGDACSSANGCDPGNICLGSSCRQLCGEWANAWNTDPEDANTVTWPNCCSSACSELTLPCAGVGQMCMYLSDGTSIVHDTAGWCAGVDEAFVEGIDCDCSKGPPGDLCVDNRSGARSDRNGASPASCAQETTTTLE